MAKKTQGTQLYTIDPADGSVLEVACVLNMDGIDTTNEQRETTCLADMARTYESGLSTPGQASFQLNTDMSEDSHYRLWQLKVAGTTLPFVVGWSDGVGIAPTSGKGVDAVTITAGGTGYTGTPTVAFSAPPSGTTATGTVQTLGGVVTGVTITDPGSGYTTAPTVTITGAGTGATATAALSADWSFVKPTTRTWIAYDGYLANFPFSFQQNSNVQSAVTVQISGEPDVQRKVAA